MRRALGLTAGPGAERLKLQEEYMPLALLKLGRDGQDLVTVRNVDGVIVWQGPAAAIDVDCKASPVEVPAKVLHAIADSFPPDVARQMLYGPVDRKVHWPLRYDPLNGCWSVGYMGMYVGIENDGYIHT